MVLEIFSSSLFANSTCCSGGITIGKILSIKIYFFSIVDVVQHQKLSPFEVSFIWPKLQKVNHGLAAYIAPFPPKLSDMPIVSSDIESFVFNHSSLLYGHILADEYRATFRAKVLGSFPTKMRKEIEPKCAVSPKQCSGP